MDKSDFLSGIFKLLPERVTSKKDLLEKFRSLYGKPNLRLDSVVELFIGITHTSYEPLNEFKDLDKLAFSGEKCDSVLGDLVSDNEDYTEFSSDGECCAALLSDSEDILISGCESLERTHLRVNNTHNRGDIFNKFLDDFIQKSNIYISPIVRVSIERDFDKISKVYI